jgi:SAM-dependent methyltransferase
MSAVPTSINYWPQSSCAKAFWSQHEAPAYQRLLADTAAWLDPQRGEHWLDLGCGGGQLSAALWNRSGGRLERIVASDCAAINAQAIEQLRVRLTPRPKPEQFQFVPLDFSDGLPTWQAGEFDGVVSGLAIQYAQSYSEEQRCWTTHSYDHLLSEVHRVLRSGGRFVFSVNVPEPSWGRVALQSLGGVFRARRPARYLKNAWRMLRYGRWLKQEARTGRFHYLPVQAIYEKLTAAGFTAIEHTLTYAGQAYLLRCRV